MTCLKKLNSLVANHGRPPEIKISAGFAASTRKTRSNPRGCGIEVIDTVYVMVMDCSGVIESINGRRVDFCKWIVDALESF